MQKPQIVFADPPYNFSDSLTMKKTKRGAEANYKTMSIEDIKNLQVKEIVDKDALLVLWCPSSLLQEGLDVMKAWGFSFKQTHVWVKTKKTPFKKLISNIVKIVLESPKKGLRKSLKEASEQLNISPEMLSFGMGRIFRQTHEIALIGTKGKIYYLLKNKSQRSVHFHPATKHSVKPEALQDMIDKMFPNTVKIELFARRDRPGYICLGNECPSTLGEDIRDSLERLKNENAET